MGNTTSTTTESSATPAAHVFQVPAEPKKKKLPDRIVPLAYSSIVDLDRAQLKELDDKYEALMKAALANQNMVRRRVRDEVSFARKIQTQLSSIEEADASPMEVAQSLLLPLGHQATIHSGSPHASGMSTPVRSQPAPLVGPIMARSPSIEVFRGPHPGPHPGPQVSMLPPLAPPAVQGVELVEALKAALDGNRKRDRSPSPARISGRPRSRERDRRSRRRSASPSSKRHRSDSPRRSRRDDKPRKRICEAIVVGTTNRCRRTALHDSSYCAYHKQTLENRLENLNAPVDPPGTSGSTSG